MTAEPARPDLNMTLHTVHRDIRVSAGRLRHVSRRAPGSALAVAGASAFAQQVMARHMGQGSRWRPGLARIFRRLGISLTYQAAYHQQQVTFRPRLNLALTVAARDRSRAQPDGAVPLPVSLHTIRERLHLAYNPVLIRHLTRTHVVTGEQARTRDRTTADAAPPVTRTTANGRPAARPTPVPPVQRVLVRANPAPASEPVPAPNHDQRPLPGRNAPFEAAPPPEMAQPPALDQITDQVMQRIEQRLIAHRERMGRA